MATKTKTKTKLSKALKNTFISELKDKKEEERLERVKANAKLPEILIYTQSTCNYCKQVKETLDNEGIKYVEKDHLKYSEEWKTLSQTTGMGVFPTLVINDNYIVPRRDFQNPQQAIQVIQILGDPDFKPDTSIDGKITKILERQNTNGYNLFMKIQHLENKLNPVINFINNLQKELAEEEKGE